MLALSLAALPAAGQATITVNTNGDNVAAGDGACTLREASEFSGPVITTMGSLTRYVATTGSDAVNECTNAACPCRTLTHAVSQANAGDTIDLAAGTYAEAGLVIDRALHFQGAGVVVQ